MARVIRIQVVSVTIAMSVCAMNAHANGAGRSVPFQPQVPPASLSGHAHRLPFEPTPSIMPIARYLAANEAQPRLGDLAEMQRHKRLRVLMLREQAGELGSRDTAVERDLVIGFARSVGLVPEWVWVDNPHDLTAALANGRGDLVIGDVPLDAADTVSVDRTVALKQVRYLVVTRRGDRHISRKSDLFGLRAGLSASSPTWPLLQRLSAGHEVITRVPTEGNSQHEVFDRLRAGEFDFTVIESEDDSSALIDSHDLRMAVELTRNQPVSWLVRESNPILRDALNHHLNKSRLALRLQTPMFDDYEGIAKRGVLRVITLLDPDNFFIYKGERAGFEYDMIREFCLQQNLRLEVMVADSEEQMLAWLKDGVGDVVTARASAALVDGDSQLSATRMYRYAPPVLVGRSEQAAVEPVKVLVPRDSAFSDLRRSIRAREPGIQVTPANAQASATELIDALSSGDADYTVVDSDQLAQARRYREDLHVIASLPEPRPYRFVVRGNTPRLKTMLDEFLHREYGGDFYTATVRRYFDRESTLTLRDRDDDGLSPFDELVKRYAERYSFDWRLIIAQMYQESRFSPKVVSDAGARGLMQVLPVTARSLGFRAMESPEQAIHAGVKYLDEQRNRFEDTLSVADRTWFALAAYHAGFDRVQAARRYARRMGWDANRWFGNVDRAMLALSRHGRSTYRGGSTTVAYVRSVRARYETYLQMHPAASFASL